MRELRVMIADDELLARKRITRLVESAPGAQLVGAAEDGTQVLAMWIITTSGPEGRALRDCWSP